MRLPDPIKHVADELTELPGIGPRQAIRLAFFLVGEGKDKLQTLAQSVDALGDLKLCSRCFFVHQNAGDLCDICANPNRNQSLILIEEKETDLVSIESTGKFPGRYFIISEIPKTGVLDAGQKIRLQSLKEFVKKELGGQAQEIILGFNPTSLGDLQSSLLFKDLSPLAKKISRLGRGLPTGGEIEFADDETLGASLDRRI